MELTVITYDLRDFNDIGDAVKIFNDLSSEVIVVNTELTTVGNMAHLHVFHKQPGGGANV